MAHTSLFIDSLGNEEYQEELDKKVMLFRKSHIRLGGDQVYFKSKTGTTSQDDERKSTDNSNTLHLTT
jgi:hypothetical protein